MKRRDFMRVLLTVPAALALPKSLPAAADAVDVSALTWPDLDLSPGPDLIFLTSVGEMIAPTTLNMWKWIDGAVILVGGVSITANEDLAVRQIDVDIPMIGRVKIWGTPDKAGLFIFAGNTITVQGTPQ